MATDDDTFSPQRLPRMRLRPTPMTFTCKSFTSQSRDGERKKDDISCRACRTSKWRVAARKWSSNRPRAGCWKLQKLPNPYLKKKAREAKDAICGGETTVSLQIERFFFSFYNGPLKSNKRTFIFLSPIRCLQEESNLSPASKPKLKETDRDVFLAFISALCRRVFQRLVISFFSNENKKKLWEGSR